MKERKKLTFWETVKRQWSLVVGLKVTGKNYIKPQITTHYPRQTVDNISTFKGHVQLVGKPKQPDVAKCICCMLCVTSCPSSCIKVVKMKPPKEDPIPEAAAPKDMPDAAQPAKQAPPKAKAPKTPVKWTLDFNLCSLCGTCVEVCPVKSIEYSNDSYLAGYSRKDFEYDLLADLKERAAKMPAPAPKKAPKAVEKETAEQAEA
ncbi:4Fe-4S binding protein [Desulfovibrio ferrophilus]|uniref:4Fe-4S ferredoxin iron-sulfur binding domain protein n=1 Tax=Desulfovibrio ferrophilus TaxID=241368 RepID=A0A2Z6AUG5_9BACT|nr:4Fe-4S binding protein [Desulfovibrio ferrophilus]BBD06868.1 4Fe-4S ferredoxin iron-sulfur binding domain protein [Desulfovibrio ferrophilus]